MLETPYAEREVHTEDGAVLNLSYIILAEHNDRKMRYGVGVMERDSGARAAAPGLTEDRSQILTLIKALARNTVTPTSLMDVIADWRE